MLQKFSFMSFLFKPPCIEERKFRPNLMQNIKLDPNITISYYTMTNTLMAIAVTEAAIRRCSGK